MRWFKHDSDASLDARLKRVTMKYGMEGYGLYWYCLELIAGGVDINNITFELEHDAEIISHDTGIHYELVQEMMEYMVKLGLFENNNGRVTCMKLAKRLDQSMTSNPELRKVIKKMHDRSDGIMINHDPVMTPSEQNRIEEKRIDNNKPSKKFTPPSVDQVRAYCQERGNSVDPEQFVNHYKTSGWMRGKTKIKDWKACVITWEKNTPKKEDKFGGML